MNREKAGTSNTGWVRKNLAPAAIFFSMRISCSSSAASGPGWGSLWPHEKLGPAVQRISPQVLPLFHFLDAFNSCTESRSKTGLVWGGLPWRSNRP